MPAISNRKIGPGAWGGSPTKRGAPPPTDGEKKKKAPPLLIFVGKLKDGETPGYC